MTQANEAIRAHALARGGRAWTQAERDQYAALVEAWLAAAHDAEDEPAPAAA
ncbi:hypothetical protein [Streptacidiphilus sp. EB129]|uniref:hypothetical protein n=1 Tax=Streptacidiphilus sp. EB129 TaxID=3156262 RepID=UPI0035163B78